MNLAEQFKAFIFNRHLFKTTDKLLVAVSGGVDSVVLCELCRQHEFDFFIAHCNFQLRGGDSLRDEEFVKNLAEKYQVPFFAKRFNTAAYANDKHVSIQEAARELRYEWFEELRAKHHLDYILTAHHANDNIETVLMNFFRGTGIKGITGIQPKHGKIVRPLLFAKRTALEEYLRQKELSFVQDVSNLKTDYTRNFFRLHLLPSIAGIFPEVEDNLLKNIARFNEVEMIYQNGIQQLQKRLMVKRGEEYHIPVLLLLKTKPLHTVLYELISPFGFSSAQVEDVLALTHSISGKYVQSRSHRIVRNRNHLIVAAISEINNQLIVIEKEGEYMYADYHLQVKSVDTVDKKDFTDPSVAYIDKKSIKFPLLLRRWKTGDYFYPLGMRKKKKVARFLIDKKLSLTEKENCWVVESDKKICWVVGYRIDDRCKVTPATTSFIKFVVKKHGVNRI